MKNLTKIALSLVMVAVVLVSGGVKSAFAYNERSIVCSGGGYFDRFGTAGNWTEFSNYGWCHNSNNWCENGQCSNTSPYNSPPFSMWRTYSGCSLDNEARWNLGNIAQWSYWYTFIPSTHATATPPYLLTYNGGSSYSFSINQNVYSNKWISLPTTQNYYQIMNNWVSDNPCNGTYEIGVDDSEICHESSSTSAYCPGNHNP